MISAKKSRFGSRGSRLNSRSNDKTPFRTLYENCKKKKKYFIYQSKNVIGY